MVISFLSQNLPGRILSPEQEKSLLQVWPSHSPQQFWPSPSPRQCELLLQFLPSHSPQQFEPLLQFLSSHSPRQVWPSGSQQLGFLDKSYYLLLIQL